MKPMLRTISFTYRNEFNPFCNKTEARLQFTIVKKPVLEKRKLISRGTIVVSLVDRLIRKLDRPCNELVFPRKVFEVFLNSGGAQGIETLDSQLVKYLGLKSQADLWSADRKLKYLLIFPMVTDVFGQSMAY